MRGFQATTCPFSFHLFLSLTIKNKLVYAGLKMWPESCPFSSCESYFHLHFQQIKGGLRVVPVYRRWKRKYARGEVKWHPEARGKTAANRRDQGTQTSHTILSLITQGYILYCFFFTPFYYFVQVACQPHDAIHSHQQLYSFPTIQCTTTPSSPFITSAKEVIYLFVCLWT